MSAYLCAVLLASGLAKAVAPAEFARALERQRLVPKSLASPVSWILPVAEIAIALAVAFGVARPLVSGMTVSLFAMFFAVAVLLVIQGKGAECGCFGVIFREKVDAATLFRDACFLAIAATQLVLVLDAKPLPRAANLVTGALAVAIVVWVVLAVPMLRKLLWQRREGKNGISTTQPDAEASVAS